MGRIIEAKAIISAEDRASAVIRKIGQEMARVGQSMSRATAALNTGRTVDAAGSAMKRAEAATRGYARATAEATRATTALRQVRADSSPGPGKLTLSDGLRQDIAALQLTRRETARLGRDIVRMRRDQEKALADIGNPRVREQAMKADSAVIEARIRARARDLKAERAFQDKLGDLSVDRANETARQSARNARRAERAKYREQHRFGHDSDHLVKHAATAIGLGYGVQGVERGAHYVAEQGAEAASEDLREKLQGFTPEQIAETNKRAVELSAQYPSVPALKIREYARKATSVTGDYHHAGDLLEDMVRARVMLGVGKGGNEAAEKDVETLVQASEGLNRASSAATLRPMLNAFVKAKALYGETVKADTFRDYTKQAGTSVVGLDDSYLTGVVPAMLQENAQWGVAQMTALGQMSRPVQKKAQIAALNKDHLLDSKNMLVNRTLARKNPYEYASTTLTDTLKRAGIDVDRARDFTDPGGQGERLKIGDKLASWFPDRKASLFWEKQILDKTKIDRNVGQAKAATGLEGAPTVLKEDPYTGLSALSAQIGNFVSVVSSPAVKEAGSALGVLAGQIGGVTKKLTDLSTDNPEAAKAASVGATAVGGGLLSYGAGSAMMRLAGSAEGVWANGLRLGGSALQSAGATATFYVPMIAGTVAGAILDNNVSQIGGTDTLKAARRAHERQQEVKEAEALSRGVAYPPTFNRQLASLGNGSDGANPVATPVTASRGFWGDFLNGKLQATYDLPSFGFRTPATPNPSEPPRRPVEFGGLPAPAPGAPLVRPPTDTSPASKPQPSPLPVSIVGALPSMASPPEVRPALSVPGETAPTSKSLPSPLPVSIVGPLGLGMNPPDTHPSAAPPVAGPPASGAETPRTVEATVKPDQITAKVTDLPPVTGEAKVDIQNQVNVRLSVDESWINAKVESAAGRAAAKIPLASSGARPGAVSMPGAASTPGAR